MFPYVSFLGAFFHKFPWNKKRLIILEPTDSAGIHCASWGLSVCSVSGLGTETRDLWVFQLYAASCKEAETISNYQQYIRQTHLPGNLTFLGWLKLTLRKVKWPETRGIQGSPLELSPPRLVNSFQWCSAGGTTVSASAFWVLLLGDAYFDVKWRKTSMFRWFHWTEAEQEHLSIVLFFSLMFFGPSPSYISPWLHVCSTAKSASSAWIYHSCQYSFRVPWCCCFASPSAAFVNSIFLCLPPPAKTKFQYSIFSREIPGTLQNGTPIPILLPYHSLKNPLKYGEWYGSRLWGPGVVVPLVSWTHEVAWLLPAMDPGLLACQFLALAITRRSIFYASSWEP